MRGVIHPQTQYPAEPLKSENSRTPIPIPIPSELALELSAAVKRSGGSRILADELGNPSSPWAIERASAPVVARSTVFLKGSGSMTCGTTSRPG